MVLVSGTRWRFFLHYGVRCGVYGLFSISVHRVRRDGRDSDLS